MKDAPSTSKANGDQLATLHSRYNMSQSSLPLKKRSHPGSDQTEAKKQCTQTAKKKVRFFLPDLKEDNKNKLRKHNRNHNVKKFINFINVILKPEENINTNFAAIALQVISKCVASTDLANNQKQGLYLWLARFSIKFAPTSTASELLTKAKKHPPSQRITKNQRQAFINILDSFAKKVERYLSYDDEKTNGLFYSMMTEMCDIFEKNKLLGSHTDSYVSKLREYQQSQMVNPSIPTKGCGV